MNPEKTSEALTKLELKKLRKLEKRQAKKAAAEELRKKCVRDHLKREQNFSLETEKRVFKDWDRMCADVKYAALLEEMQQIKQNVLLLFDRKNNYIERLFGDRAEIEDIYGRNLLRLKRLIDCYLEIHQYFVTNLSNQYQEDSKLRLQEFGQEVQLKEHIEKRDRLRDENVQRMEHLHGEIKSILNNYFTTILHPDMEKAYQNLCDEDKQSQIIIQTNRNKIKELNLRINHLTKKITEVEIAGTRKIISKKYIKRKLEEEIDTLKRDIIQMDVSQMDRMKKMSYEVFHVQKHLEKLLEKGKLILNLAQTCCKYECEDDVNYYKKRLEQSHSLVEPVDCPVDYAFLFDKINRVKAINVLQREERDRLLQANRDLQRQFQQYCQLNSPEAKVALLQPTVKTVDLTSDKQ
ncbi:AAEL004270-PA [Aedes aegypti]|uniref:Dynein regulatory complex subunit 2 n=1 Tax=Aedes aegypti TaxID=7159 RepID=Q17DB2_AEDAE|nr:AAEL004270-PA [Aedes aegypti]